MPVQAKDGKKMAMMTRILAQLEKDAIDAIDAADAAADAPTVDTSEEEE